MNRFEEKISLEGRAGLYADGIDVIQVNVGLRCNQSCAHCHLSSSPENEEMMDWPVMEKVLEIVRSASPGTVDITGGAPELNPNLKTFIRRLSGMGIRTQVRTNLTALLEPGNEGLPEFFREQKVMLVGSLPCYLEENVTAQRGEEVYGKSIEMIRQLNSLGYGTYPALQLNLVYNPGGAFLPGDQADLEKAYRKELHERFGISFTNLLTITNMPLGRFKDQLKRESRLENYEALLSDSFNPGTVPGLMCRHQISIRWDGTLYDCDFNLVLDMVMNHGAPDHINKWKLGDVVGRRIVTGTHCFGCTAGRGSSCAGELVAEPQ
jgi:radical SAM/Cys-rich protein